MSKGKSLGRKTPRVVRRPATRFAHLQKRMRRVVKEPPHVPRQPTP